MFMERNTDSRGTLSTKRFKYIESLATMSLYFALT